MPPVASIGWCSTPRISPCSVPIASVGDSKEGGVVWRGRRPPPNHPSRNCLKARDRKVARLFVFQMEQFGDFVVIGIDDLQPATCDLSKRRSPCDGYCCPWLCCCSRRCPPRPNRRP